MNGGMGRKRPCYLLSFVPPAFRGGEVEALYDSYYWLQLRESKRSTGYLGPHQSGLRCLDPATRPTAVGRVWVRSMRARAAESLAVAG